MFYRGTIVIPATSTVDNLNTTGSTFTIPKGTRKIGFQSDVAGVFALLIPSSGSAVPTTGSRKCAINEFVVFDLLTTGINRILGINNPNGITANVKVFLMD